MKFIILAAQIFVCGFAYARLEVIDYSTGSDLSIGTELYPSSYLRDPVPLDQEYTFEKLTQQLAQLQKEKAKVGVKIEDAIALLPSNMLNKNYVVMYRSRSLQGANPQEPRIIAYTPTARLMVTFNSGNPKQAGHNTLEVIQYRDSTQSFEFREIEFNDKKFSVSAPNPAKCLVCHQSPKRKNIDPRPNWEPYSTWPGAIGSNASRVYSHFPMPGTTDVRLIPEDIEFILDQRNEQSYLDNFAGKWSQENLRYRQLGTLNSHAATDLTDHLAVLNASRVIRLMEQQNEIHKQLPELPTYLSLCSVPVENPIFKELEAQSNNRYFDYTYDPNETSDGSYWDPEAQAMIPFKRTYYFSTSQKISSLYEALGVDTSDWSMDFATRGRLAFYERFGTPSNTYTKFDYALKLAGTRDLTVCRQSENFEGKLKAFLASPVGKDLLRAGKQAPVPSAAMILKRCSSCHEDDPSQVAPIIVFSREDQLRRKIKESKLLEKIRSRTHDLSNKDQQMPPARKLTFEERKVLLKYLEGLL